MRVLTDKQRQALDVLMDGGKVYRAAAAAGVTVRTISRWLHENETFAAEYKRRLDRERKRSMRELIEQTRSWFEIILATPPRRRRRRR